MTAKKKRRGASPARKRQLAERARNERAAAQRDPSPNRRPPPVAAPVAPKGLTVADPAELTVAEVRELARRSNAAERRELARLEREGKARVTALRALEAHYPYDVGA